MKVAVIGTSNIGAVKYAADRIAAAHPDLALTCYGLPGGKFDEAKVNADGVFLPNQKDRQVLKLEHRINGTIGIDLNAFAHILVIGDTLGMPATLWTALNYDIADWPTRTGRDLLSLPAFLATIDEAITLRADHLRAQFGDHKIHVALAPYPTTAVVPKGAHHQQPYAGMATHPHAADIHALYRLALIRALRNRDMIFIPQPDETIASPFLTRERYGHGSMDFRAEGRLLNDHRHMNADFGASLFDAFALAIGATPHA
ncbi:hypothetical protein KUL25_20010 [Rhodobacteraceae bacterium N5(2021)]|uniref:Uncharacterized protein n=1 Tax=Gymnodinialimonas phycosphaerae TaxID=2841589 RepID=A0A975TUH9_9RHOB|nr:hypothetical protein [Gymnodinialimonas phycosphaerae]MBY4895051.1 hypothetical protein [Gymnodinialimonas phycosphaerae]